MKKLARENPWLEYDTPEQPLPTKFTGMCLHFGPYHNFTECPYLLNPYLEYLTILGYIHYDMVSNATSPEVGQWSTSVFAATVDAQILYDLYNREKPKGAWDQKVWLHKNISKENFSTPIWGDPVQKKIGFDIWANIAYGYTGRGHSISKYLLFAAQCWQGILAHGDRRR